MRRRGWPAIDVAVKLSPLAREKIIGSGHGDGQVRELNLGRGLGGLAKSVSLHEVAGRLLDFADRVAGAWTAWSGSSGGN